ncbi:MAG: DNA starvation/stationary phase protection protein [Brevinematales bacterium]|nr:DNA starvation/stationary phase protection protein [Brevinematales bacterium]
MIKVDVEKIDTGLSEKVREQISSLLFKLLSDEFVLYVKARNYHWNVVGPHFKELHEFFQKIYEEIFEEIDDIAERIRALGLKVPASLKNFLSETKLEENNEFITDKQMLENLLKDHEIIIKDIRKYIEISSSNKDEATTNFLAGILEKKEKIAWMIRATLEK